MHDRLEGVDAADSKVVELSAEGREARLTAARYWRLDAGLRWLRAGARYLRAWWKSLSATVLALACW